MNLGPSGRMYGKTTGKFERVTDRVTREVLRRASDMARMGGGTEPGLTNASENLKSRGRGNTAELLVGRRQKGCSILDGVATEMGGEGVSPE